MKNHTTTTAEPLMEELLTARNAMDQLARLGAQQMLQKALEIEREVLGERHPSYATSLNGLAVLYHSMGDYARAEPL